MTRMALAAFFAIISFDASAIVRYMVQGMTCAEVREALDRDGVAILFSTGEVRRPSLRSICEGWIALRIGIDGGSRTNNFRRYRRLPGYQMY